MSASPPKADMTRTSSDVCLVLIADIATRIYDKMFRYFSLLIVLVNSLLHFRFTAQKRITSRTSQHGTPKTDMRSVPNH